MEKRKLDRINELARKKKNGVTLTEEELAEQTALRKEYVEEFRRGTIAALENTYLQRPDDTREKLHRRD